MHTRTPENGQGQSPEPVEPFQYELLVGHERTDGVWKSDEALRMQYIELTDGLIHQMTNGVEVKNPATGETEVKKPDVVVWLDKSARPLAWLTKELWPTLAPDPATGETPEMPDFKFVNIDREQWVNKLDPEMVARMDIKRVDQSIIRSLRSVFMSPEQKKDGLTHNIDKRPAVLDNKTILIVDEVRSTGRTLDIAKKFFERAFPTSQVAGTYWMQGVTTRDGAFGNLDLPVWYQDKNEYGRGVANRDDIASSKSPNSTQRLGAWFLSRRFPQPDQAALKLREEFHHMAQNPEVPILPSRSRPDFQKRISLLNGGVPLEQVVKEVRRIRDDRRRPR